MDKEQKSLVKKTDNASLSVLIEKQVEQDIRFIVLKNIEDIDELCNQVEYMDKDKFCSICELYGYPVTVVIELQYTDKMYRDAYYIYLAHLHFDIGRHCKRLSLFKGIWEVNAFFDSDYKKMLENALLGTIVIRPSYNYSTEYTMGRTLLNPYRMLSPLKYVRTAKFKVSVCGQKYMVDAFPFSNQHGDVLRCAETSVWALMEYYGTRYDNYSTILPSTILNWSARELPAHSLPSDGLTYEQISGLLKSFNFEPRIYPRYDYNSALNSSEIKIRAGERMISFKNVFHYYVESGIPIIAALQDKGEDIHHSIIIIGHDERNHEGEKLYIRKEQFEFGGLKAIDSSVFYEHYIVIDDNQIPYRREKYDNFSDTCSRKVDAFIVPLYRHILLDAIAAVNIIETVYKESEMLIKTSIDMYCEEGDEENIELESQNYSVDNPVVLRYYLTTSRSFVDFRSRDTEYLEEKLFYDTTPFPKFIWVGEYSTLQLYKNNRILGEIVVDATAPKYSGIGAVISMRFGGFCASRHTDDPPQLLKTQLEALENRQARLVYGLYTNNLQKGDLDYAKVDSDLN